MYIMLENQPTIYFDFEEMIVEIIDNNLVPWGLKDKIKQVPQTNVADMTRVIAANVEAVKEWMSNRVLSLSRDNAKQIYKLFRMPESNDTENRVNICLKCRGVSATDCYWIKSDEDNKTWEQMNVRKNYFDEIVDIALYGEQPSVTINLVCPELTTKGSYRKAWIREPETKELFLLKSDRHSENINTRMEVLASHVMDCFTNVPHVQYAGSVRTTRAGKIYVSECKNFVDERYSFVEAGEVMEYCRGHGIDFEEWAIKTFGSRFANIAVVDYLIMNTDRHDGNYGFMMDNMTGQLVEVAPLFDYNLALVSDIFGTNAVDTLSPMLNNKETIKDLASRMLSYSNIDIDFEKLKHIEKDFKEYPQVYNNILARIHACYGRQ